MTIELLIIVWLSGVVLGMILALSFTRPHHPPHNVW